jgi:hypothetical protein
MIEMRGFFAALRNDKQKQIPFGNDKQKDRQRQAQKRTTEILASPE